MDNVVKLNSKETTNKEKSTSTNPADDYSPLKAAKFESEFSKYLGSFKSPAKAYRESEEFRKEWKVKSASLTKSQ